MAREEIIGGLKFTVELFLLDPNTGETLTEPRNDMDKITVDACRGAIALLEQEPINDVLDKIRAEIEQNAYPIVHGVNNHEKGMTLYGILQIIDKYKSESKVSNAK